MKEKIVIGTRGSRLALWQAEYIADCLRKQYPAMQVELKRVTTTGDRILDVPLAKIGGKGLFTKEIETEMLDGTIDLAVHSLKDMPTELPEGLFLSVITKRVDPHDALISPKYRTLAALPQGARVGTSSLRRQAQLLSIRPDLEIHSLRGNVDTRLKKAENGEFDAVILAAAGLKRLGLADRITEILAPDISLPAVGQGALAIESRIADSETTELLAFLNDEATRAAVTAERAFLRAVEGGCQVPVGVYAADSSDADSIDVQALIASVDGKKVIRRMVTGKKSVAEELGRSLAGEMLNAGGREIMHSIGIEV